MRSIAAPYYLTDLGVRHFEDPALFLSGHETHFGWPSRHDPQRSAARLRQMPLDELADALDALVLLTGDYPTALAVTTERIDEILPSHRHLLLVYAGVILASAGDRRCRELLEAAAVVARRPGDRFMALHRLAAAEVKRFDEPQEALRLLALIESDIDGSLRDGIWTAGDARAMGAVVANLRALALLRSGARSAARDEMHKAVDLHTIDGLREVALDEAVRYSAQERINVAQLLVADGQAEQAVATLEDNVAYCAEHGADYLGEALSALAYGLFLADRFDEAALRAQEAAQRIAYEASPVRLRAVREIHVGALASAGDRQGAVRILEEMEEDPLGLRLSTEAMQS